MARTSIYVHILSPKIQNSIYRDIVTNPILWWIMGFAMITQWARGGT
jgi:hypothetical protein